AVPRRDLHGGGRGRGTRSGVPGLRRVRDGRGGGRDRLAGPGTGDAGDADRDPPGRCADHPHVLGGRGGPPAARGVLTSSVTACRCGAGFHVSTPLSVSVTPPPYVRGQEVCHALERVLGTLRGVGGAGRNPVRPRPAGPARHPAT